MGMFDFFADRGGYTYEDVQRRRALVDTLSQTGSPTTLGGGLSAVGGAIGAILGDRRADRAEEKPAAEAGNVFEAALNGMPQSNPGLADALTVGGATFSSAAYEPTGDALRDGIVETANAIGADPVDLATAISYETAGTFDPTKAGPTTQWGQHEGLIQFGQPQQQQYGVDLSSREAALSSQLGADGAIAKYFRSSGFKPGMSGLDLYSTINAGAPGRYSASDANNGGAPGSVADKWNNQMGAHREKAMALLGGAAPQAGQPAGINIPAPAPVNVSLIRAMSNPYLSPEQKQILGGIMAQQQAQQITPYQMAQLQMKQREHTWQREKYGLDQQASAEAAAIKAQQASTTDDIREFEYAQASGYQGSFADWQVAKAKGGATNVTVDMGGSPGLGKLSTDYGYVLGADGNPVIDPETGLPRAAAVPGSPAAQEAAQRESQAGLQADQAILSGSIVRQEIARAQQQIEAGGILPVTGFGAQRAASIGGTAAHDLQQTLLTVQANIGFDRLQQMREASPTGGALGAISDRELATLQSVAGSLAQSQSKAQLEANLTRLDEVYNGIMAKASAYPNAGQFGFSGGAQQVQPSSQPAAQPQKATPRRRVYNPQTGDFQ